MSKEVCPGCAICRPTPFVTEQKPQDQQWPLFQCDYCKRKFQNHHGSCPGCGSPHTTIIWTPETHSGSYYRSYPTY